MDSDGYPCKEFMDEYNRKNWKEEREGWRRAVEAAREYNRKNWKKKVEEELSDIDKLVKEYNRKNWKNREICRYTTQGSQ